MAKTDDTVMISRVANGWVVRDTAKEILHMAVTPESLAAYVAEWAGHGQATKVVTAPSAVRLEKSA